MSEVSHTDIYRAIGRLEGKLDSFLKLAEQNKAELASVEKRVASLERAKGWLIGLAAGLGLAAGSIPRMFGGTG